MYKNEAVPFNDLSRIHRPLLEKFKGGLTQLVENSNLVLGKEVVSFEQDLASTEGCNFAIGVNNGTSALELALRALGIGEGDEVITTAFTFVATIFSILQTGALPVLVDIDPLTGLLDPAGLERAITPKTKAIVFVTLHGRVECLDEIQSISRANNLFFVIDAAQSHLGRLEGNPQTHYCDAATLSFYPGKNLGALGEGGAILTNSQEVRDKILLMRDWGASEKYNHTVWGGNFRLEALQACFLRIKLGQLQNWTNERVRIANVYRQELEPNYLMKPSIQGSSHVYHIFAIIVKNREKFSEHLSKNRIGFGFHYPKAIHQQPAYSGKVINRFALPNSEWLAKSTLSIPIFPGQTQDEVKRVIEIVNQC